MTGGDAPRVWAGIVGQSAAVALLQRAIAADRLAHAYAFVGPSGVGRRLTAVAFASGDALLGPRVRDVRDVPARRGRPAPRLPGDRAHAAPRQSEGRPDDPDRRGPGARAHGRARSSRGEPEGVRPRRRGPHDAPDRPGPLEDPRGAAAADPPRHDHRQSAGAAADAAVALPAGAVRPACRRKRRRGSWRSAALRPRPACSWRGWPRVVRGSPSRSTSTPSGAAGTRRSRLPPSRGAARRRAGPSANRPRDGGSVPRALLGLVPGRALPRGRRLRGAARQRRPGARPPRARRAGAGAGPRRRLGGVKAAWVALEGNANPGSRWRPRCSDSRGCGVAAA